MTQMFTQHKKRIKMKKLNGMKGSFSSAENKKLKNLKSITGGNGSSYSIKCNLVNSEGATDTDYYNDDGSYKTRGWLYVGPAQISTDLN
ncbi:TIGR04139 family peptide modification target [Chryseobacterium gleum]|nr:TIGR04139 family peptide modification target [Chryseobacterium gleum]